MKTPLAGSNTIRSRCKICWMISVSSKRDTICAESTVIRLPERFNGDWSGNKGALPGYTAYPLLSPSSGMGSRVNLSISPTPKNIRIGVLSTRKMQQPYPLSRQPSQGMSARLRQVLRGPTPAALPDLSHRQSRATVSHCAEVSSPSQMPNAGKVAGI